MTTRVIYRIAAVLILLFDLGHTAGYPWSDPSWGVDLGAIQSSHFKVLGFTRTYWNFYVGFGLAISLFQLMQAVVLWQLAGVARTDAASVRPMIAAFSIAYFINTLLSVKFFFVIPLVTSLVIALVLALAFYFAGRSKPVEN